MDITADILIALGASSADAQRFAPDFNAQTKQHDIETPLRVAHFLAQVFHESGHLKHVRENLNYSAAGLLATFPRHFTPAEAEVYARKPERIGNHVYANRMGNGDEASGDGFRFRGRGFIQLTGRNAYEHFGNAIGDDLIADPDKVAENYPVHSAVNFWKKNGIDVPADADDVEAVTRKVNGGTNGLADRRALLNKAKHLLKV